MLKLSPSKKFGIIRDRRISDLLKLKSPSIRTVGSSDFYDHVNNHPHTHIQTVDKCWKHTSYNMLASEGGEQKPGIWRS